MKPFVIESRSVRQTERLGRLLGRELSDGGQVGLVGSLGAGKTVMARSILRGFGIRTPAPSPSFTLVHKYQGRLPVYHVDLYRLHDRAELVEIGWNEIVTEPALVVVEWFDRFARLFPGPHLEIRIDWPEVNLRRIELISRGSRYDSAGRRVGERLDRS